MQDEIKDPAMLAQNMSPCDREVFERVWRRVMPQEQDCPIQMMEEEATAWELGGPAREEPGPEAVTLPALPACSVRPGTEAEGMRGIHLGPGSAAYAALLEEMMDGETEDARLYQALARRAGGSAGRALGAMAAEERRHARRLSAAHFLITGCRHQPRGQGGSRPVPELSAALREQFLQEQREAASYQAAAAETTDPCLAQLWQELAREELMHARLLRNILEQ